MREKKRQDGGSTLHKEASVDHCTTLVFLLYPWSYIHVDGFRMYTEEVTNRVSRGEDIKCKTYLWTSLSPLLFVICHVSPLLGSRPGWEISNPCFLTSWIYLEYEEREIRTLKAWNRESPKQLLSYSILLVSIEVLNSKIFIPNKNIIISCYDVWMQKSLCIPPYNTTEIT